MNLNNFFKKYSRQNNNHDSLQSNESEQTNTNSSSQDTKSEDSKINRNLITATIKKNDFWNNSMTVNELLHQIDPKGENSGQSDYRKPLIHLINEKLDTIVSSEDHVDVNSALFLLAKGKFHLNVILYNPTTPLEYKIRDLFYSYFPLALTGQIIKKMNLPTLPANELMLFQSGGALYENKITGNFVGYTGLSGNSGMIHAGGYNIDREQYRDMVLTIGGMIFLTNKRLIISGTDTKGQGRTKYIPLTKIVDLYAQNNTVIIETNGYSMNLNFKNLSDAKSLEKCFVNLHLEPFMKNLPNNYSINEFMELVYHEPEITPKNPDELRSMMIQIFDGHIFITGSDNVYNDYYLIFDVKDVKGSLYFRNLIILHPEQLQKKIQMVKRILPFLTSNGIGITIIDFNYNDAYTLLSTGSEYISTLGDTFTATDTIKKYQQDTPIPGDLKKQIEGNSRLTQEQNKFLENYYLFHSKYNFWVAFFKSKDIMDNTISELQNNAEAMSTYVNRFTEIRNRLDPKNHSTLLVTPVYDSFPSQLSLLMSQWIQTGNPNTLISKQLICIDKDGNLQYSAIKTSNNDENRKESSSTTNTPGSLTDEEVSQLKKYKDLLDSNIISQSEFNELKERLLKL